MHFRGNFKNSQKGRQKFNCQKLKIFVTQQNFIRTLEIHYKEGWFFHKIFDNSHLKFGKMKKAKIKKQHFRQPVNRKPNFFQNWVCYYQIRFCSQYAVLKYQPLKDGFRSISQKFYRAVIQWWVGQKTSNLYKIFLLVAAFKKCIVEFTAVFVCLLFS